MAGFREEMASKRMNRLHLRSSGKSTMIRCSGSESCRNCSVDLLSYLRFGQTEIKDVNEAKWRHKIWQFSVAARKLVCDLTRAGQTDHVNGHFIDALSIASQKGRLHCYGSASPDGTSRREGWNR
jgi:hypothetical protein